MKKRLIYTLPILIFLIFGCKKEGCTDPKADNYDEKAEVSDGSCSFANGVYSYLLTSQYNVETKILDASGYWVPGATVNVYWKKNGESTLLVSLESNSFGVVSHYGSTQDLYNLGVENGDMFVAGTYSGTGSGADTTYLIPGGAKIHFDDIVVQ